MAEIPPRLSTREKLGYGLGDGAANLVYQTQITFLLFFFTDVFGLSAATAGSLLLISRVLDAVNDPIVGAIADRTVTRWGRYRPWVLLTALPLAAALVLCFTTPDLGPRGKLLWAIVTYNAVMILYAANNIPYCALSGVMTDDSAERTSLASWRFFCAISAALVVNSLTLDLVDRFGGGNRALGFSLTMLLWGAIAVVLFTITFATTRERLEPIQQKQGSVRQDLADLFRNGPWIALFVLSVLISINLSVRGGTMLYYFTHFLQRPVLFGLFNGFGLAVTLIGVAASKPLVMRLGKRSTMRICLLLSAVFMAMFAVLRPDDVAGLFALQALLQLSIGPTIPILWAMMADVADYSEWKTGRRATAMAFASIVFGGKVGFGVGGWLSGSLLDFFGYVPGATQSSEATHGIVMLISLLPAALLALGAAALFWYRIDTRLEQEIEQTLRIRRGAETSA